MRRELRGVDADGDGALIRVAAIGDVHVGTDAVGVLRNSFARLADDADVLLLAGDLTQHGSEAEAAVLAEELRGVPVPVVAVLGNHDYHTGGEATIRRRLEAVDVAVLEGDSVVLEVAGQRLGVAGCKGFGGGFAGACASEFGEVEMKEFVRHTKRIAAALQERLAALDVDVRVALTHYAPIKETLMGERLEIYPFLGSFLLGEAIDHGGCDLALHGHAHRGTEHGITPGGIAVRNVARPVLRLDYKVYNVSRHVREPALPAAAERRAAR
jgi:Icc-related predicted phosphoesterase